jgi:hypothetical protein
LFFSYDEGTLFDRILIPLIQRFLFVVAFASAVVTGQELTVVHQGNAVVLRSDLTPAPGERALILRRSLDLESWDEIGRFKNFLYPYPLSLSSEPGRAFYQVHSLRSQPSDDWANQLVIPQDDLISRPSGGGLSAAPFVKFTVELKDPERVYFQDSSTYPFHFQFIRDRLPGYEELGLFEFETIALRRENQELLLGAVILAPDPLITEAAIQFVGQDSFALEDVAKWFDSTVQRFVVPGRDWRFFYIPTFEQREVTFANEDFFLERGIAVDTAARWASEPVCYSNGWALGRLVFVPASEIDAAYGDGRLRPVDILVTDQVPAEIPIVAGVISLEPATPNSHVVILARSFNVPFVFASGAALQAQISRWDGQEVLLIVSDAEGDCNLELTNVEGRLTDEEREAILVLKLPPPIEIQEKESANRLWFPTEALGPEDGRFVGGKAANFGLLRRALPDNSPESIAFSFDLWDAFMEQKTAGGTTLRAWIQGQLAPHQNDPPIAPLRQTLRGIQDLIKDETQFGSTEVEAVIEGLRQFEPGHKIRFRSSTNVEDSEQFSGAGLYDSYSGCLLDDLDSDTSGPSLCDSEKTKERGVFRAIRKVFASFYNENAYLERLRHGIDEETVAMGILVHHSFYDELELANGVATLDIRKTSDGIRTVVATMVTQLGAVSVTNPDTAIFPELVVVSGGRLEIENRSSLLPINQTVMDWESDYLELARLLDVAAQGYEEAFSAKDRLLLDFEYKKMAPGELVVKQIRIIPQPTPVPPPTIE